MSFDRTANAVDFEKYPIHELDSDEGVRLMKECHVSMEKYGAIVLSKFLKKQAVDEIIKDIEPCLSSAYFCKSEHNVYLIEDDNTLPDDHPRNRKFQSNKGVLAYDQISDENLLRELYNWKTLRDFLARVMKVDILYPYIDTLSPININVNKHSQQLAWHYDNSAFSITLMLRPAQDGGVYEFVPWIRSTRHQNFEELEKVICGKSNQIKTLSQDAGALVIFKGKHTIHRVTPTMGDPRLVAVLSYSLEPKESITERTREIFYGRIE